MIDGLGNVGAGKRSINTSKVLTNTSISGKLNILIDEFVPCLKDAKTGEILDTEVALLDRKDLKKYKASNGWGDDWFNRPDDEEIFGIFLKGESSPQGLVALRYDRGGTYIALASTAPHNNKLLVGNKQRYLGVGGHLFALAVEQSVKHGGGGTIFGYAVNQKVLNHYIKKFGAVHMPIVHDYQFLIEGEASVALLKKYTYTRR